MDQKISYGIIGLIAILAGFGGSQLLDQDTLDHTYYCNTSNTVGVFTRLSSTEKTGYFPDAINASIERSKVCTNSKWIKLTDYAQSKGIDPATFLMSIEAGSQTAEEKCYPMDEGLGCVPI